MSSVQNVALAKSSVSNATIAFPNLQSRPSPPAPSSYPRRELTGHLGKTRRLSRSSTASRASKPRLIVSISETPSTPQPQATAPCHQARTPARTPLYRFPGLPSLGIRTVTTRSPAPLRRLTSTSNMSARCTRCSRGQPSANFSEPRSKRCQPLTYPLWTEKDQRVCFNCARQPAKACLPTHLTDPWAQGRQPAARR